MPLTEAEKIERHRMFTVPAHQRNTNLGPEIIPQTVYIASDADRGAVAELLEERRAPELIRYISDQELYNQFRPALEFAYESSTTRLLHDFKRHGGGYGANPFRCTSSAPQGTTDLTRATSRACEACMDFAYAVVFGVSSDDDDFAGLTVKFNRGGRREQKVKRNLAGFLRTAVNNKARDLFRHIASRDGGLARIDANRVPGDLSPEVKEIVAILIEKLNNSKCTSIPLRALADFYATAYGCDTTTAIKRVRDILKKAATALSRVRVSGSDWWTKRILEPLERNRATPLLFGTHYDTGADRPRELGDVIGGEVAVAPGQESVDSLPAGGGFPFIDDESTLLIRLRRAQDQIMESFDSAAYAADPEGEHLRLLRRAVAKIDFVVSHCAPDTPQSPSSMGIEVRRLAAQWADDIIASKRLARERLAMADE